MQESGRPAELTSSYHESRNHPGDDIVGRLQTIECDVPGLQTGSERPTGIRDPQEEGRCVCSDGGKGDAVILLREIAERAPTP